MRRFTHTPILYYHFVLSTCVSQTGTFCWLCFSFSTCQIYLSTARLKCLKRTWCVGPLFHIHWFNWPIDNPHKMASWRTSFVGSSTVFTCQSYLCKSLSPSPSPIMHRSAKFHTPPKAVDLIWSCEGLWMGSFFCVF